MFGLFWFFILVVAVDPSCFIFFQQAWQNCLFRLRLVLAAADWLWRKPQAEQKF
jgi:hypothetical protein